MAGELVIPPREGKNVYYSYETLLEEAKRPLREFHKNGNLGFPPGLAIHIAGHYMPDSKDLASLRWLATDTMHRLLTIPEGAPFSTFNGPVRWVLHEAVKKLLVRDLRVWMYETFPYPENQKRKHEWD